jgi:tetratricopeptide (TPR) repeat protein
VTGFPAWVGALPTRNRWIALGVAAILVVALIGGGVWTWLGHREEVAQHELGSVLVNAEQAVESGQAAELEAAAKELREFLAGHARTRAGLQAWYVLGQVEFRRSRWDAAVTAFGEVSRGDRGSLGRLSRLAQGYAHEAKGEPARAFETFQQALAGLGPNDFLYGDLLLAKARVQEQTKDSAGAIATYKQYLKDLPTADQTQDVRIRLALLGSTD